MNIKTLSLALLLAAAPAVSFAATPATTDVQSTLRLTDDGYSLDKFSKLEGVECMTLDKAMLKMAMDMGAEIEAGSLDAEALKAVDKMTIATGESKAFAALVEKDIETLKAGTTYTVAAEETKDGEHHVVFTRSTEDSITEMLMFVIEAKECNVVKIEGQFTADMLKKMAESED